jgi:hypothetical protein
MVIAGSYRESLKNLMRAASANSAIRAFNLGPSFLKQHDPYLSSSSLAKNGSVGVSEDRYVVIDHHLNWNSTLNHQNFVDALLTIFKLVEEDIRDSFPNLSQ